MEHPVNENSDRDSSMQRMCYSFSLTLLKFKNNYLTSQTDLVEDSVKDVERIFDYYIQNLNNYKCCFTFACFMCDSAFNIGKYSIHN